MSFVSVRVFGLVLFVPRVRFFSLLRVVLRAVLAFCVALVVSFPFFLLLLCGCSGGGSVFVRVLRWFFAFRPVVLRLCWLSSLSRWSLLCSAGSSLGVRGVRVVPGLVSRRGEVLWWWCLPVSVRVRR